MVVAVDANGADMGPSEVAAGRETRGGAGCACAAVRPGRASSANTRGTGCRGGRRARVGCQERGPCACGALDAGSVDRAGSKGRRRRSRGGTRVRGRHRSGAGGRAVQHQARARHPPSSARAADTCSRIPTTPPSRCSTSARARRHARAPGPVRLHGGGFRECRARRRASARRFALKRRGVRARQRAGACKRAAELRERLGAARGGGRGAVLVRRQRRGRRHRRAGRRCDRHRWVHRQHRAEADGGCLPDDARRCQRCGALLDCGASWVGCCCAHRCGAFARKSTPKERAGPTCWVCVVLQWSRTGALARRGFAQAILRAERGAREDVVGATHSGAEDAGALRKRSLCPPIRLAWQTNDPRASVRPDSGPSGRRARCRAPSRSGSSTHFKDDLGADSLDLYTLVQELEDTYGVKIQDEQALRS